MLHHGLRVIGDGAHGWQLLWLILDASSMRELSVVEQRYLAVVVVIAEGHAVASVAQQSTDRD